MRIIEQHKLIQDLRDYVHKMKPVDRDDFDMFAKRDKDDEELDNVSYQKLERIYSQYVERRSKKDMNALLKKYSEQLNRDNK